MSTVSHRPNRRVRADARPQCRLRCSAASWRGSREQAITTLRDIEILASQDDREALARVCLFYAVETAMRYGRIQTVGRSEAEIKADILNYLEQIHSAEATDAVPFGVIVFYRDVLLRRARSFRDAGDVEDSLLYYATWIEHWLNDAVSTLLRRRGLEEGTIISVLR
jgi:hypothetical protein